MNNNKSLIIYFSRADENYSVGYVTKGNTEVIAEYIKDITGADLFKVERKKPYAKDYQTAIEEAKEEQNNNERPELVRYLDNINEYDTIYIGSPIYWGTMPQPMFTQLEKLNWAGKKVRVFITHEGSEIANALSDVKKICEGALVDNDALTVYGHDVLNSKEKVVHWVGK